MFGGALASAWIVNVVWWIGEYHVGSPLISFQRHLPLTNHHIKRCRLIHKHHPTSQSAWSIFANSLSPSIPSSPSSENILSISLLSHPTSASSSLSNSASISSSNSPVTLLLIKRYVYFKFSPGTRTDFRFAFPIAIIARDPLVASDDGTLSVSMVTSSAYPEFAYWFLQLVKT